jgi:SnoaL-like domain
MDDLPRLVAIEEIRRTKTRYWNGFDFKDPVLLRSAFADAVLLDYRVKPDDPKISPAYFTDPDLCVRDMLAVLAGYVSSHQGHSVEVDFLSDTEATGVWALEDRFWFRGDGDPPLPFRRYHGWGHYQDRYIKTSVGWRIAGSTVKYLRVETS